ncbi:DUF4176 domain-containing protein [uncultured Clostridium sp.]|uniref:DUF4176 domain-containing protein n=1 Tax=uncultured Clostridium sp. TaxID=59620 RepID=UPI00262EBB4C|nr:DUF4176 domain-containing protein [uncultured Clostridium sp.]
MVKLLPIGSIVSIDQERKEKILIIGRLIRKEIDGEVFDYCGCKAPVGVQGEEELEVFNHKEIKRLLFIGFQDEEEMQFSHYISKEKEKLNESEEI